MRPNRVRIDRLTQGVVPGALFDEEPWFDGKACVRIELRNPEKGETGLLLLLLKDLLSGDLSVGGTASIGRGLFDGRARLLFADGFEVEIKPDKSMPASALGRLDQEIQQFRAASPRSRAEQEVAHG